MIWLEILGLVVAAGIFQGVVDWGIALVERKAEYQAQQKKLFTGLSERK